MCLCPLVKIKNWNWYRDKLAKGSMTRNEEPAADLWATTTRFEGTSFTQVLMIHWSINIDLEAATSSTGLFGSLQIRHSSREIVWNYHEWSMSCVYALFAEGIPSRKRSSRWWDAQSQEANNATVHPEHVTVTVTLPRSRHSVKCSS